MNGIKLLNVLCQDIDIKNLLFLNTSNSNASFRAKGLVEVFCK